MQSRKAHILKDQIGVGNEPLVYLQETLSSFMEEERVLAAEENLW